ncbi:sugar phosphate nucleotidyltransferase [Bacillus tianshenii]|nr:sugar phosphate nucleotidyltransferase [Bacillus tianshenii]
MKAVILAGGKGTRLRPLTCNLPKPMLPIMEKPVLQHLIELLQRYHIKEAAVTVEYMSTSIKRYFGDGEGFDVDIQYFEEKKPLGTAGAINSTQGFCDETFLVISGDIVTDFDLAEGLAFHRKHGGVATVFSVEVAKPQEYGVIFSDENGKITDFEEKPRRTNLQSRLVNTGVYIFNRRIFDYIPVGVEWDISRDLIPSLLAEGEPIYTYSSSAYWKDVGTTEQYRQVHEDILRGKVNVNFSAVWNDEYGVWMGDGVSIEEGAFIKGPAYIGSGAVIRSGAKIDPYSVVGSHAEVQHKASIRKSIIWQNSYIGEKTELRGAIIAEKNVLWNGAAVYENGIVGSASTIGADVVVRPEVKIWPYKKIEHDTVLDHSLVWGHHQPVSLFQGHSIIGKANIEMTPEFIVNLAGAYKAVVSEGDEIIISSDNNPYTSLLKDIFIHTVRSGGINVLEEKAGSLPVVSFALAANEGRVAGIYLEMQDDNVIIQCLDENGERLNNKKQYELERAYKQHAFPNVPFERIGKHTVLTVDSCYQNVLHTSGDMRFFLYEMPCGNEAWTQLKESFLQEGFYAAPDVEALSLILSSGEGLYLTYEINHPSIVIYTDKKIPHVLIELINKKIQQFQRV